MTWDPSPLCAPGAAPVGATGPRLHWRAGARPAGGGGAGGRTAGRRGKESAPVAGAARDPPMVRGDVVTHVHLVEHCTFGGNGMVHIHTRAFIVICPSLCFDSFWGPKVKKKTLVPHCPRGRGAGQPGDGGAQLPSRRPGQACGRPGHGGPWPGIATWPRDAPHPVGCFILFFIVFVTPEVVGLGIDRPGMTTGYQEGSSGGPCVLFCPLLTLSLSSLLAAYLWNGV
jgi:hypothetical protein